MKGKIINLFDESSMAKGEGVEYSELLKQLIEPYIERFAEINFQEDIIDFAINAWNIANMKILLPEDEMGNNFDAIQEEDVDFNLLISMVDYKIDHFKTYTNFIIDYEFTETSDHLTLSVVTQEETEFLGAMAESMDADQSLENFDENYIDRTIIIVRPLQPFKDWLTNLYPDEADDFDECSTYLINEDTDIEVWLKTKYNKLFTIELEGWHTNKKEWPQNRNYKMFKQWFQIEISTMPYDLEGYPVSKFS